MPIDEAIRREPAAEQLPIAPEERGSRVRAVLREAPASPPRMRNSANVPFCRPRVVSRFIAEDRGHPTVTSRDGSVIQQIALGSADRAEPIRTANLDAVALGGGGCNMLGENPYDDGGRSVSPAGDMNGYAHDETHAPLLGGEDMLDEAGHAGPGRVAAGDAGGHRSPARLGALELGPQAALVQQR